MSLVLILWDCFSPDELAVTLQWNNVGLNMKVMMEKIRVMDEFLIANPSPFAFRSFFLFIPPFSYDFD